MVFEGKEKDDFWNVFDGGKEPYASDKRLQVSYQDLKSKATSL